MRNYRIKIGAIAPSGQWRFQRSDSDSDDRWDVASSETDASVGPSDEKEGPFRDKIDPDAAHALLLAAARAVRRMWTLRIMRFVLDSPLGAYELEVDYMVDGGGVVGRQSWFSSATPFFTRARRLCRFGGKQRRKHAGAGLVVVVRDSRAW